MKQVAGSNGYALSRGRIDEGNQAVVAVSWLTDSASSRRRSLQQTGR
jgi:hypothetical protein